MNQPLVIGITGGSGSGKTSIIKTIRETFSKKEICIISLDDYYKPIEKQKQDNRGITNFDLPGSIDKKALLQDLEKLIKGKIVTRKEYTFNNKKTKAKLLTYRPTKIIIVEGLFVFHYRKINALLDLRVYVHAKENLKLVRRIIRDQIERNYPLDDVLYRYEHHVLPSFEKYIEPYQDSADIIINNNSNFNGGLDILIGFLKNKL